MVGTAISLACFYANPRESLQGKVLEVDMQGRACTFEITNRSVGLQKAGAEGPLSPSLPGVGRSADPQPAEGSLQLSCGFLTAPLSWVWSHMPATLTDAVLCPSAH